MQYSSCKDAISVVLCCLRNTALFLAASIFTLGTTIAAENDPETVSGEYLIKYSDEISQSDSSRLTASLNLNVEESFESSGVSLVTVKARRAINIQRMKDLLASGTIETFEPNYLVHTQATTPNDPRYRELWGLNNTAQTGGRADIDIDAPEAWDLVPNGSPVVVGVIDTGVEYTHQDLTNNVWINPNETANNGIDDDNNGVIDDIHGFNAINRGGNPLDDNGHGTHCSGTIAATANNNIGISGVAPLAKIMGIKFLDASGSGSVSDAIAGIEYAIKMKSRGVNIRVLSNSWGGGGYSQSLENAIKAANNVGILFIAAAGNEAANNDIASSYPANYALDNVISIGAIDASGNLASFSNYGANKVHVAAPGVSILSTYIGNRYALLSGTSMATPHVSGVAALLISKEANITTLELKSRIINSVKPLSSLNNIIKSGGVVSAARALTSTITPAPSEPSKVNYNYKSSNSNYDSDLGERITQADDLYLSKDLGFSFPYYGASYTKISISTNGRVVPITNNEGNPTIDDFANSVLPGINVFQDDLIASNVSGDGGVWFKADSSGATITWVSIPYSLSNSSGSEKEIRVQAKLNANGDVYLRYGDTTTGSSTTDFGASATISISPTTGGTGDQMTISHNTSNQNLVGNGKSLKISSKSSYVFSDFDSDGVSDLVVWRPLSGQFFVLTSNSNYNINNHLIYQLGLLGDLPKIGDFDGDKKPDLAVYRPSNGTWYLKTSSTEYKQVIAIQWGLSGDVPLIGDTDGDGKSDLNIYRQSSGTFYSLNSSSGFNRSQALAGINTASRQIQLGGPANDPLLGDFNGDGRDEYVAIWQLIRFWSIKDASGTLISSLPWGNPGDTPLSCNLDSDKSNDRVISRINPNNLMTWFSANTDGSVKVETFGSLGDQPSCQMDIDSDGVGDLSVFRGHSAEWFIKQSTDGSVRKIQFGLAGDIPIF